VRIALQSVAVLAAIATGIALLGVGQRLGWWSTSHAGATTAGAAGDTVYTCPMHPQIRQPTPGSCPICGMPLEPLESSAGDPEDFAVNIPVAARRLANIETVAAEVRPVFHTIETVGSIAIDESRQSTISAYVDGRLERLFADYTGVQVAKGDHLAILYSPSLFEQQAKYIEFSKKLTQPGESSLPAIIMRPGMSRSRSRIRRLTRM